MRLFPAAYETTVVHLSVGFWSKLRSSKADRNGRSYGFYFMSTLKIPDSRWPPGEVFPRSWTWATHSGPDHSKINNFRTAGPISLKLRGMVEVSVGHVMVSFRFISPPNPSERKFSDLKIEIALEPMEGFQSVELRSDNLFIPEENSQFLMLPSDNFRYFRADFNVSRRGMQKHLPKGSNGWLWVKLGRRSIRDIIPFA